MAECAAGDAVRVGISASGGVSQSLNSCINGDTQVSAARRRHGERPSTSDYCGSCCYIGLRGIEIVAGWQIVRLAQKDRAGVVTIAGGQVVRDTQFEVFISEGEAEAHDLAGAVGSSGCESPRRAGARDSSAGEGGRAVAPTGSRRAHVAGLFLSHAFAAPKNTPQPGAPGGGGGAIAQGRPWSSTFARLIRGEWPIEGTGSETTSLERSECDSRHVRPREVRSTVKTPHLD